MLTAADEKEQVKAKDIIYSSITSAEPQISKIIYEYAMRMISASNVNSEKREAAKNELSGIYDAKNRGGCTLQNNLYYKLGIGGVDYIHTQLVALPLDNALSNPNCPKENRLTEIRANYERLYQYAKDHAFEKPCDPSDKTSIDDTVLDCPSYSGVWTSDIGYNPLKIEQGACKSIHFSSTNREGSGFVSYTMKIDGIFRAPQEPEKRTIRVSMVLVRELTGAEVC